MASGHLTISRRGHNGGPFPGCGAGRRVQGTPRNRKPRISSAEGIAERYEARLATHPSGDVFPKSGANNQRGRKPGSRNPRKVGR
jgi:hypothetical protein